MKYATCLNKPKNRPFQPLDLTNRDDVNFVAHHSQRWKTEDSAVVLCEFEGEVRTIKDVLEDRGYNYEYTPIEGINGHNLFYIEIPLLPVEQDAFTVLTGHDIFIDWPTKVHDDGTVEVTVVGSQDELRSVYNEITDILDSDIKSTGDYPGLKNPVYTLLNERQREVLQSAYELGYYDQPRQATYDDIASEFECTAENIGDIIRRSERKIMSDLIEML